MVPVSSVIYTSKRSHIVNGLSKLDTYVYFGPTGSEDMREGMLRLRKEFLNYPTGSFITILMASIVYNPATIAVVVTRAGVILPALILTSINFMFSIA